MKAHSSDYPARVGFRTAQKTLERLDWPRVLEQLAGFAQTPAGRRHFSEGLSRDAGNGPPIFEDALHPVRARLRETAEARALLNAALPAPLGGVGEIEETLARAAKGGVLRADDLRTLAATLAALDAVRRHVSRHGAQAPRLAEIAESIGDHGAVVAEIGACIDASGEILDAASPALAAARRESVRLASEIEERIAAYLRDPDTVARLSDAYFTVRNDRFVLPVRADARSRVRGIVHGASKTGTTLFVEPEALVDLNNQRKRAEIDIEQETGRVLLRLSRRVAAEASAVAPGLRAVAAIDRAFARGRYAEALDATPPEVADEGVVRLPQLRHPLLPADEVVPNDVALGEGFTALVISGPNAGGKTVAMKAVALAGFFVRAGLHVPAAAGARIDLFDQILVDIGDEQDIREQLSTFSAHMTNVARIVDRATAHSLVVLDELGVGTDPGEGAALAQAVLEKLADAGARTIVTTHYNLLKEMAEVDERFINASVDFDPDTLEPTYRLKVGTAGTSSARAVAARMGLRGDVLLRASEILDRDDRRLDGILAELAVSRNALEREQREAARVRAEAESIRDLHREKLQKLQQRRDALFESMRTDLDRSFRDAHAQVAGVIRDLQRGGRAQDAARARERLLALQQRARDAETAATGPGACEEADAVDWQRARSGDAVKIVGAGAGVLEALPDRRGRVAVRVGSARLLVPHERVRTAAAPAESPGRSAARVSVQGARPDAEHRADGDAGRCDLRGLRVDEAIDRLVGAFDRAAAAGRSRLTIVHGVGTGALCCAVREYLSDSPYVGGFRGGDSDEGGDGVTIATLR